MALLCKRFLICYTLSSKQFYIGDTENYQWLYGYFTSLSVRPLSTSNKGKHKLSLSEWQKGPSSGLRGYRPRHRHRTRVSRDHFMDRPSGYNPGTVGMRDSGFSVATVNWLYIVLYGQSCWRVVTVSRRNLLINFVITVAGIINWKRKMKKRFVRSRTFASSTRSGSSVRRRIKSDMETIRLSRENSEPAISSPRSPFFKVHAWNIVHPRKSVRISRQDSPVNKQRGKREDERSTLHNASFITEKSRYVEVI